MKDIWVNFGMGERISSYNHISFLVKVICKVFRVYSLYSYSSNKSLSLVLLFPSSLHDIEWQCCILGTYIRVMNGTWYGFHRHLTNDGPSYCSGRGYSTLMVATSKDQGRCCTHHTNSLSVHSLHCDASRVNYEIGYAYVKNME